MKSRFVPRAVLLVALCSTALFASDKSWLDRILPKKNNQVDVVTPAKPPVQPHPEVLSLQNSFAKVVEAVKPAVVNIQTVQISRGDDQEHQFYYGDPEEFFRRYFGGEDGGQPQRPHRRPKEYRAEGEGSGVIIDPDGYILTNNHVVAGANQVSVTLSDGKVYKAKVIGTDERTDLAIVKIKGTAAFPFAQLGDSSATQIGDWVIAFGSPFGLEQTVTAGIISAIRQSLNIEGKAFRNLLQTDAAINRGNSGGPLVNISGEVVGINTAIYAPTGVFSGIGFAIPVNDAKLVLKDLMEKGYVERSWMGVEIAEVNEVIANQFGLDKARGALVNQVVPKSPASEAGLQRGDIILTFNGKDVKDVQDLQDTVSTTAPGRSVKVKIVREGKERTLDLKTAQFPKSGMAEAKGENGDEDEESDGAAGVSGDLLGASVGNLTPRARNEFGIRNKLVSGVVVTDVPPDSAAAEAGLAEGDIIRSVNRVKTESVRELKDATKSLDPKKGVVIDVLRRGRSFYLTYKSVQ